MRFSITRKGGLRLPAAFAGVAVIAALVSAASSAVIPSTSVSLEWHPNPEADVGGYKVHFGTESGIYSAVLDVGLSTKALLPPVSLGTTYYLAVSAYNSAGVEGPRSAELVVTAAVPEPAAGTTLSFGAPGEGTLQWRYPKSGVPAADEFTVYASEDLVTWNPAGTVSVPARSDDGHHYFEFPYAADKPRMFFRVGASNAFGEVR